MAAWVNLDGLDNEFNGLLMTDRWKGPVGQCHWQLTRSGRMDFGVNLSPSRPDTLVYRSSSLPETDDMGRWLHLAVVYDVAAVQVSFYVDGRQVCVKPLTARVPLVLGPCEFGNWLPSKGSTFPDRTFHGRIDELMILRRALNATEVKTMYEEGRP